MRKDLIIFAFLALLIFAVWYQGIFNFFAQDDFILINQFSQNTFWQDLVNSFGPPAVTHWRPVHNLYFLTAGNLFGKSYFYYHLLTFLFHLGVSFLIYKVAYRIFNNRRLSLASSIIYAVHPAHFISLFWISGAATTLGIFFLLASFYGYLLGKQKLSVLLFILSLLASEAMVAGLGIFWAYEFWLKKKAVSFFTVQVSAITVLFLIAKIGFLTLKETFEVYQVGISLKIFTAIKYYILRILGFAEVSGDTISTIIMIGLLTLAGFAYFRSVKQQARRLGFWVSIVILGLFPFVFIGNLSPHYMNVSIFGFAMLIGLTLSKIPSLRLIFILLFAIASVLSINLTYRNNWVVNRSNLAKTYLYEIASKMPPLGTTIVFRDTEFSSSKEAYLALGTGKAVSFWFADKNYKTCFTEFENCTDLD